MPDTIEDRAVVIRMRRRAPGESVAPYRHRRDRPALQQLHRQLHDWLRPNLAALERAEPDMPLEDRAADTWEPLIAVADHAGSDWPERARTAALSMLAEAVSNDQGSIRTRLLADCRTIFGNRAVLPTTEILRQLNADTEAPWRDYGSTGLTAAKLSKLLAEFDIKSGNIRFSDGTQAKGYRQADFVDAWTRYCPRIELAGHSRKGEPSQPSQPSHPRSARDASNPWDGTAVPPQQAVPA